MAKKYLKTNEDLRCGIIGVCGTHIHVRRGYLTAEEVEFVRQHSGELSKKGIIMLEKKYRFPVD